MKKVVLILAAGLALQGCAGLDGSSFRSVESQVGQPITLSLKSSDFKGPSGSVLPGMKGKWQGKMVQYGQSSNIYIPMQLYISGSSKRQNLAREDLSIYQQVGGSCTYGLGYIKTELDGTVIYARSPALTTAYCPRSLVRVQPMDSGQLRVSDHEITNGKEIAAGIFSRMIEQ